MRKLAEKYFSNFIVCQGRSFFRLEISKTEQSPINPDDCSPAVERPTMNSLESRFSMWAAIACVLFPRRFAQIISPIVQRVVVFVIALFMWLTSKDYAMHRLVYPSPILECSTMCIKTFHAGDPLRAPIPLREPFKISGINDGVLPLCQRNQSVRLIDWLSNRVAFHTTLAGHWSSLKGLVLLSQFKL